MTAPFDWAGLWTGAHQAWKRSVGSASSDAAAAYLRTRIEAVFVPVEENERQFVEFELARRHDVARAEAAEARNKVLEHIVRRYMASTPEHDFLCGMGCGMGALHNCTCDLHAVNELTRQALGGEHEHE